MKRKGGRTSDGRVCVVCQVGKEDGDFYPTKTTRNTCIRCVKLGNKQGMLRKLDGGELTRRLERLRVDVMLVEAEINNRNRGYGKVE